VRNRHWQHKSSAASQAKKPLKAGTAAQAPPCLPCFRGCSAAWTEYQKGSGGGSIAAIEISVDNQGRTKVNISGSSQWTINCSGSRKSACAKMAKTNIKNRSKLMDIWPPLLNGSGKCEGYGCSVK
jgi:hypothetical protein